MEYISRTLEYLPDFRAYKCTLELPYFEGLTEKKFEVFASTEAGALLAMRTLIVENEKFIKKLLKSTRAYEESREKNFAAYKSVYSKASAYGSLYGRMIEFVPMPPSAVGVGSGD